MKKFIAILMSLVFAVSSSVVAFADPPELDTPVQEEIIDEMYDSHTYTVPANTTLIADDFYLSDPYFAFEMTATLSGGGTSSSSYRVALKKGNGTKVSANFFIDGVSHKVDWINISSSGNYHFEITNNSSSSIYVTLTYYSWT